MIIHHGWNQWPNWPGIRNWTGPVLIGSNKKDHEDMTNFNQSLVEDAALAFLENLGYAAKHGQEIAPGELLAEQTVHAI